MKIHSKASGFVAFAIGISLIAPSFVFAQDATTGGTAGTRPERAQRNFCTAIDELVTKVGGRIGEREIKYQEKRTELRGKLDERFANRDVSRADHRDGWDKHRAEWLEKLNTRAKTDAQKSAVAKFIADIDAAVAARRAAVDAAVAAFRASIDQAIKDRQAALDAAVATFKSETDAALVKAKADCAVAGAVPKAVREAYVAALKAAREKLRSTVSSIEKRKDTLKPLAEVRKEAIKKAVLDFRAAVNKAKDELKAAFPKPVEVLPTAPVQ